MMLCRETPTASASCCCVQPRSPRSSLTRLRIVAMSSTLYVRKRLMSSGLYVGTTPSSRASSRDGMRRPTSSGSRKIALQNVLEGTRKEIGHGEVYQSDQHSDERNRIGFGGRVERLGGSGRVGHGGASRTGEDDRERVAESVRSD